jgi:acyl-coenzyme A thioesterase PaaI-like protein
MNVLDIPFHKFLGLKKAESGDDSIYQLEFRKEYLNHLGIMHASVLFALADATSGEFLYQKFKNHSLDVVPVIRNVQVKYRKPVRGPVFSKADFWESGVDEILKELHIKKRVLIKVAVDILDQKDVKVITSILEWMVTSK